MRCKTCSHQPYQHGWVTYPRHRQPCNVCVICGSTSRDCCLTPKRCQCNNYQADVEPEPTDRYTQDREASGL